ncbi:VOC family protein [Oceaniglobus trochenteri]|uniref:VOC family protein n=1 Tax=Oceaniglobus trochenteri TaxID=2763260 RepID=UPI001CFFAD06|nr:VOC family protein [Oceaniglobus trochenteri]
MPVTRINFMSIPVHDQDRAIAFYRDRLGMTVHTDATYGEDWRWIFLQIPGAETMIQFAKASEMSVAKERPALVLVCDDVDAEVGGLKTDGVTLRDGPDDAPWQPGVRYALIEDTEGNVILLESFKGDA